MHNSENPICEGAAPVLSILVVAYNSRPFIEDCLRSVIAHTHDVDYEILLIDNGEDDTEGLVRARFDQVRIVPSEGNIGFAGGNNRLAQHACGRYFLLLNPDTILREPAIDALVAFAREKDQAVVWGGLELDPDGSVVTGPGELPTLGRMFARLIGFGRGSRYARSVAETPVRVEVMSGCFMMISADAWRKLDGFDESFFLYSEEIDLFERIRALGGQAWTTPASRIEHVSASGEAASPRRMLLKQTGAMHYAWKHWGAFGGTAGGVIMWITALQRMAVNGLLASRSAERAAIFRGLRPLVIKPWQWWDGYRGGRPRS